jgi:hypothetical protein
LYVKDIGDNLNIAEATKREIGQKYLGIEAFSRA